MFKILATEYRENIQAHSLTDEELAAYKLWNDLLNNPPSKLIKIKANYGAHNKSKSRALNRAKKLGFWGSLKKLDKTQEKIVLNR